MLQLSVAPQCRDTFFKGWVGHEKALEALTSAAGDTKRRHLVWQVRLVDVTTQFFKGRDHFFSPCKMGAAGISTEFALTTEPEHDETGENTEDNLCQYRCDIESGTMAPLGFEHRTID